MVPLAAVFIVRNDDQCVGPVRAVPYRVDQFADVPLAAGDGRVRRLFDDYVGVASRRNSYTPDPSWWKPPPLNPAGTIVHQLDCKIK